MEYGTALYMESRARSPNGRPGTPKGWRGEGITRPLSFVAEILPCDLLFFEIVAQELQDVPS